MPAIGERLVAARPPGDKQLAKIIAIDEAVRIQVGRAPRAGTPARQQQAKVVTIDERVAVEVRGAAAGHGHRGREADGWKSWIEESGAAGVPGFKDEVGKWLQKPVNWLATESWPEGWSGQCRALSFFQDQEFAMLKALGIVVVEGDRPGSSYYAAELRGSIDDANAAAAKLELPFRFRRATR
jgi:hypothetical protein